MRVNCFSYIHRGLTGKEKPTFWLRHGGNIVELFPDMIHLPGPLIIFGSRQFNILPICLAINVFPVPKKVIIKLLSQS